MKINVKKSTTKLAKWEYRIFTKDINKKLFFSQESIPETLM